MIIQVELYDGSYGVVSQEGLDRLLEHNLAKRFKRGSGWAIVGIHPIRLAHRGINGYNGRERRQADHSRQ